ncbi:hypothetical protein H257_04165 [Aphanomyces astaci]|uniref:Uncharacterized protein n=1 Tax=Aphanomyces astaci TaxID=112090 RepID=W4GWZ7_APHAT|nr:hypothetical protein H257_04165 [Aphanomyces astaci]ETV83438.1 hypothetical protein H257_04165 [Aphanomyces astaci]|eukprot:XP_009826868.1 hypothetical protein H257_04165 [Aphanomyces astaci]
MEDTSPGVVRDSATIEPWTAPGLGDDTKNGMVSRPPQTKGVPGSEYKDMQQEGGIQERLVDRLQTETRMLPPSDKRHGPGAQPRPVPLPDDSTVSTEEGGTIGAPGAKVTLQQQTDLGRGCDEAPGRGKTIGQISGTTGPSAGDNSRQQTGGSEVKEEEGMYAESSKGESSCRQTEPNTRDANASPDGKILWHLGVLPSSCPGPCFGDSTNLVLDSPDPVMAGSGAGTVSAITNGSTQGTEYSNLEDLCPDSDIAPVSTAPQIDAISRGDMAELPDCRHVDIEERHYSIWLVGAAGATGENVAGNIRTFRDQPWCFGFLRSALREAR